MPQLKVNTVNVRVKQAVAGMIQRTLPYPATIVLDFERLEEPDPVFPFCEFSAHTCVVSSQSFSQVTRRIAVWQPA